ncbi:MAG TPA: LrgB family protein [Gemmatimonadaceae bacterium]|jgi:predicted murein hydrolase (TIGR00659 family)
MSALWWIAVTVLIYAATRIAWNRTRLAILNPAIVSIAAVMIILLATHTPYAQYERGGRFISFWLGPAVVALGLPLAQQLDRVRRNFPAISIALLAGAVTGISVAVTVAWALGAPPVIVRSLAPRSATTPIAIAVTTRLGGLPALSAVVSIVSGALGGFAGVGLLRLAGVRSRLATGLALGAAAHGLGTARAADEGDVEGGASGLAMGVMGILTALLAPVILALMLRIAR